MGKDLRGKELGKGLTQEKSGFYMARFVDRFGKRQSKRFKNFQDARKWLADSTYMNESSNPMLPNDYTVDAWFEEWIETKKYSIRPGTIVIYKSRYKYNIQPVIGNMKIKDVRPAQCQIILNNMADRYAHGTIQQAKRVMHGMFLCAYENGLISSNPCMKSISAEMGYPAKMREALSDEDLKKFLKEIKSSPYENQYRLILNTGIRIGELVGLKWTDIDFENKCLYIRRTMRYISNKDGWRIGEPKSKAGKRTIPLSDEALEILKNQKDKISKLKVIPFEWREYVFLNDNGELIQNNTYLASMNWISKKLKINHYTPHNLRHTFASRWISAGLSPKVLQTIIGHQSFELTMMVYVHSSEDEKRSQIEMVSKAMKVV